MVKIVRFEVYRFVPSMESTVVLDAVVLIREVCGFEMYNPYYRSGDE